MNIGADSNAHSVVAHVTCAFVTPITTSAATTERQKSLVSGRRSAVRGRRELSGYSFDAINN